MKREMIMVFGCHSNPVNTSRERYVQRLGHCPFISQDEKEQRKNGFPVRCSQVWNFPSRQAMDALLFEPFSTALDKGRENMPKGAIRCCQARGR